MTSVWVRLSAEVDEAHAELAALALHEHGAEALEWRDGTLQLPPDVEPPAQGRVWLRAFFAAADDALEARDAIAMEDVTANVQLLPVVEKVWAVQHPSVRAGRIWVGPPEQAEREAGDAEVLVLLPPGRAFGNGDHPSTLACLEYLDAALPARAHEGVNVLDVGTGTGVLAIAARKLGAARVVGVDISAEAVDQARQNAQRNGVDSVELSTAPVEAIDESFELVIANILDPVLLALAAPIAARLRRHAPAARLILSGIRASERDEVVSAYEAQGLRLLSESAREREGHANRWVFLEWGE